MLQDIQRIRQIKRLFQRRAVALHRRLQGRVMVPLLDIVKPGILPACLDPIPICGVLPEHVKRAAEPIPERNESML